MTRTKDSATAPPTNRLQRGVCIFNERGVCAGCGETGRTLRAPRPNVGRGYAGPMYCTSCNPRYRFVDMHASCLERLG